MYKSSLAIGVIALGFLGWQSQRFYQQQKESILHLKEEALTIEYSPASNMAALTVEAESEEGMGFIELHNPQGFTVMAAWADESKGLGLSGFKLETRETSLSKLFATYAEGDYAIRAQTSTGLQALGRAALSHRLLAAPVVTFPFQGQVSVPTNLTARWECDPQAGGYRVILEQDENDGLSANLRAGSSSFQVPEGVLLPGIETKLELVAIARNGNGTMSEIRFTTR